MHFSKGIVYPFVLFFNLILFSAFGQVTEIKNLQQQLSKAKDSLVYVDVLNRIGYLTHMKSADSCLKYGMQAKSIADRLSYTKGKADAIVNIGSALYLKGLYSHALSLFTDAMVLYDGIDDHAGVMRMYMNSAVVYEVLGDTANAVKFSKKSIAMVSRVTKDSLLSMQYANYGYFLPKSNADSSRYYLSKAEEIAIRFKDSRTLLVLNQLRGEKLVAAGKFKEALPLILKSLAIARSHQLEFHEITSLDYYASYFLKRNLVDSAILCYNESYQIALKSGFLTFKTEILKSMLKAYKLKKDPDQIARTNELLVEALEEEGRSNRDFAGDYISYSKAERELRELELNQNNDKRIIIVLVVFSFLALAAIVYILSLNKKLKESADMHISLNHKITDQNDLLVKADQFKSNLISVLAHDFRSPLASTIGIIHVLKEQQFEKEELDVFYDSIQNDLHETLLTFDNILQWVKKQYTGYVYKPELVVINDLIDEAASVHKNLILDKQISLVNLIPETTTINTDKEMIQFINRNLLHNAIKFSPEDGNIMISAVTTDKELIISVQDEGIGMTQEQQEQLFSFIKGNASGKGAGVALTICKEFISILNGRIWTESGVGKGTAFFYSLPLAGE